MRSSKTSTAPRSARISSRSSQRVRLTPAAPDSALAARFAADLDRLIGREERLGIAVSGGPDSLALLLLARAARPGHIEAATVDHQLRPEAAQEAQLIAAFCSELRVPHSTLQVDWGEKPASGIQERARAERYRLLARWARERSLGAIATGHHLDDQVETVVMRLNRGAGVRGLAAMRERSVVPGSTLPLLRPLLGWRREELAGVCAAAGLVPAEDPSNRDEQFERVRIRSGLASADWMDPSGIAASAAHLATADEALEWAAQKEWEAAVDAGQGSISYRPEAPAEIRRRIAARAVQALATEGAGNPIRGNELDRLVEALEEGGTATLRGVCCSGGAEWVFAPAPRRRT